jgi:hypothetical protein
MAGVLLTTGFNALVYGPGHSMITKLINELGSNWSPLTNLLQQGVHRVAWLLAEAIAAAVLAWKMPPVTAPALGER